MARSFEFLTEGIVDYQDGTRMESEFRHRYEVESNAEGSSSVSYTMRLESMKNGMWRLSLPIWRSVLWKFGLPYVTKPGFNNLLRMAEAEQERVSGSIGAS